MSESAEREESTSGVTLPDNSDGSGGADKDEEVWLAALTRYEGL